MSPEILHFESRSGYGCLDLSVAGPWRAGEPEEVWVSVEGFSIPADPVQVLQMARWLLQAYLEVTALQPPRELENPVLTTAQVMHAVVTLGRALP